jgi:hypothetical protein
MHTHAHDNTPRYPNLTRILASTLHTSGALLACQDKELHKDNLMWLAHAVLGSPACLPSSQYRGDWGPDSQSPPRLQGESGQSTLALLWPSLEGEGCLPLAHACKAKASNPSCRDAPMEMGPSHITSSKKAASQNLSGEKALPSSSLFTFTTWFPGLDCNHVCLPHTHKTHTHTHTQPPQ